MERTGYIYKLTSPNGKSYIGQTVQEPCKRWSKHHTKAMSDTPTNRCEALSNAIKKHGWDNFTKEIIETCSESDLDDLEQHYIEHFNTVSPNGYNLTHGGRGGSNTMSDETKAKMRETAIYRSKRVYKRKDENSTLPRCVQKWRNSYRVEMVVDGKRVHKCFNITTYGDEEALRLAIAYVDELRPLRKDE